MKIVDTKVLFLFEEDYQPQIYKDDRPTLKREAFEELCKANIAYFYDSKTMKYKCIKNRWVKPD